MTDILPIGYVTILQAADILQPSMFGGVPDRAVVTSVRRQMGMNGSDGLAKNKTIDEIWEAVDAGNVQAMAIGGERIVKLAPEFTKQIHGLRSPTGRGFTLVRPSNPAFHQLADWFGRNFSKVVTMIFEEAEIRKLASKLRRRRRKSGSDGKKNGRPSDQTAIQPIICEIVNSGKWNTYVRGRSQSNRQDRPVAHQDQSIVAT